MDCLYETFTAAAAATGNVTFRTGNAAAAVRLDSSRKSGKATAAAAAVSKQGTTSSSATGSSSGSSTSSTDSTNSSGVLVTDAAGQQYCFDDVILAVHSKAALGLLDAPSRLHTAALGGVEYYTQSTIMHTDEDFIRKCVLLILYCTAFCLRGQASR
jgi:hypothetical protein